MCRLNLFPAFEVEPMELVAQRLFLWDMAYGYAGVAMSDHEQHTRRILWRFVEYCHSMDELDHFAELARRYAKRAFVRWLRVLKIRNLTDRQKELRERLKEYCKYST